MHLKFINEIPNVAKVYPMERSKDVSFPWVRRMRDDYSAVAKQPNYKTQSNVHAARCPGIFHLLRHGWIMRTWSDIAITTNGDGISFEWRSPNKWDNPLMDWVHEQNYSKFMDNWPDQSLKHLLKFNTGWRCEVPKGYYLLEMPIPYQDDWRFEVMPGTFIREYGAAAMNPFIRWNVKEGTELIPAGTPLSQYILVPREEISFSCEEYDPKVHDVGLLDFIKKGKFVNDMGFVKKFFGD